MERLRPALQPDQTPYSTLPEAPHPAHDNPDSQPEPPPTYPTGMGKLSFDQLYQKTSRTVGYVMREVHGMTNPEDIDDCMQSGYLKVWEQLQKDPDHFADKPKRYIVQAVVFRSKAQRYSHLRHYHKIVYDADVEWQGGITLMSTNRVDTWIDLAGALEQVAYQVEDTPAHLLGLYCLITQVSVRDVATTFGMGYSTLMKKKYQVRADLAAALEGYGPQPAHGKPTPMVTTTPPERSSGLVTTRLLEAAHDPADRVIYQAPPRLTATNGQHKRAEDHEPFPDRYPTHWGGDMTLEQIITDPVVRRAALAKTGQLGLGAEDQADCVQQGCIRLWQKLRDEPNLLFDKGPVWAGIFMAYSGNPKQFHRHNQRQQTLTRPAQNGQATDADGQLDRLSGATSTHADWVRKVDESIDVDAFIHAMKQRYADDPRKQVALQAVTGAIPAKEAAQQLGINEKNYAAAIGNPVRREVQAHLPDNFKTTRPEPWAARLARGEGVEHITQVAQEIMHDQRLLLALYVVTTSVTKKAVAQTFGYGLTRFGKDIRTIKAMIAAKYQAADRTTRA